MSLRLEKRRGAPPFIVLCLVMTAGVSLPGRAEEQAHRVLEANLIRLEGYLGPPRRGAKATADLRLTHAGKEYRFQATQLRVLTGKRRSSTLAADAGAHPSFLLRGADAMVQRLDSARPGDRIVVIGYQRPESHDLLVAEITIAPPDAPHTAPAKPK